MSNFDVRLYDEVVSFNEDNPVRRRFSLGRWQLCYLCMQQTRGAWTWAWKMPVMQRFWADADGLRALPVWTTYDLQNNCVQVCRVCAPTKDACLNLRDWLFGEKVNPDGRVRAVVKAREMAQHNSPLRPWHNPRTEHA